MAVTLNFAHLYPYTDPAAASSTFQQIAHCIQYCVVRHFHRYALHSGNGIVGWGVFVHFVGSSASNNTLLSPVRRITTVTGVAMCIALVIYRKKLASLQSQYLPKRMCSKQLGEHARMLLREYMFANIYVYSSYVQVGRKDKLRTQKRQHRLTMRHCVSARATHTQYF